MNAGLVRCEKCLGQGFHSAIGMIIDCRFCGGTGWIKKD